MQLEDYFEFEKFDSPFGPFERIRIKGHRIAIDNVLEFYNQGVPAEEIVKTHYPTLTLEEVYATLTYYLHNREVVDAYLRRGEEVADGYYQEYLRRGPFFAKQMALEKGPAQAPGAGETNHEQAPVPD
jgi:uncharacterized protein (DUF433 family)